MFNFVIKIEGVCQFASVIGVNNEYFLYNVYVSEIGTIGSIIQTKTKI